MSKSVEIYKRISLDTLLLRETWSEKPLELPPGFEPENLCYKAMTLVNTRTRSQIHNFRELIFYS